jgi:hypothetical protein
MKVFLDPQWFLCCCHLTKVSEDSPSWTDFLFLKFCSNTFKLLEGIEGIENTKIGFSASEVSLILQFFRFSLLQSTGSPTEFRVLTPFTLSYQKRTAIQSPNSCYILTHN